MISSKDVARNIGMPEMPDAVALVVVDDTREIAAPRPAENPARVYVMSFSSPKTRQTFRECITRIERAAGCPPGQHLVWSKLTHAHTSGIAGRLGEMYAKRTVRLTLQCLRGVLETAYKLGQVRREDLDRSLAWGKPQGRTYARKGHALTNDELARVFGWFATLRGPYGAFLTGLFAAAIGGGLRASEIAGLPAEDGLIRVEGDKYALRIVGKGNKVAKQVISLTNGQRIERWLAVRRVLDPVCDRMFVRVGAQGQLTKDAPLTEKAIFDICAVVAQSSGIARFGPHDLRRTLGTGLYRRGCSDKVVQHALRHADERTTKIYDTRTAEEHDETILMHEIIPTDDMLKEVKQVD